MRDILGSAPRHPVTIYGDRDTLSIVAAIDLLLTCNARVYLPDHAPALHTPGHRGKAETIERMVTTLGHVIGWDPISCSHYAAREGG